MITAVDTNILIDVIEQDDQAIEALALAATQGQLVVGEIVYAEMCAGMSNKDVEDFCQQFGIKLVHSTPKALGMAGQMWLKYKERHPGRRERVLADFMVASHAMVHANRLLTQDRGFYRDYFKDLTLI